MTGMEQFLDLFGNITILNLVEVILAAVFLYVIYKKMRNHLIAVHEAEVERDRQLQEALTAVRKYPVLENELRELRKIQEETTEHLMQMEEQTKRRERNKLRDRLLQNYRYYINPNTNPTHSWTKMEAEAFWELFKDYEEAEGDGYVHTVVQPAMELLTVIDVGN